MKLVKYLLMMVLLFSLPVFAGGDHPGESETDAHGNEAEEHPSVAVSLWTEKMELFMEYPVLVTNESGRFIIHLTILEGFQPVREGEVILNFVNTSGTKSQVIEKELLREGIFAPHVELQATGGYEFQLIYNGPAVSDTFMINNFSVYASADQILYREEVETGDEISFLKEQQWKIPFSTIEAENREVKRAIWAIGEVLPSPNAYVEIVSPVEGVVHVRENSQLALPGSLVKRGASLATITPPVQGNGWANSQLAYEQAKRDYERAGRLKERQAISDREYEQIRNEYMALKAGFETLSGKGEVNALELHAPISGKIIEWQVRPGQRVKAGDKLMAVVDPNVVWLRVNVYENDYRTLGNPVGAYIKANGPESGLVVNQSDMKVLTSGGAIDPVTRTVPVLLELSNRENRLHINETTPVELYASDGIEATSVPKSSIYEEDGIDVVYIQTGGESFEKRIVTVGPHYNGWVAILKGLQPGDRVVTTGGYQVKLASSSAEIGHGHAH